MDPSERTRIEAEIRAGAARKIRGRLGFYWHLVVFGVVNVALAGVNLTTSPEYLWFLWPLAGWGIGLAFHGFGALGARELREQMIEAEVRRELARRGLTG